MQSMRIESVLSYFAAAAVALGCSSSNDNPTNSFCQELQQKNDSCQVAATVNCSSASSMPQALQDGIRACLIPEACTVWTQYVENLWTDSAALSCFAQHGIQFSGAFDCADGNGSIPQEFKCDGKANCPDGSDEVSCADAG